MMAVQNIPPQAWEDMFQVDRVDPGAMATKLRRKVFRGLIRPRGPTLIRLRIYW